MGAAPISTMMINVVLEACCMFACFAYMKKLLAFPTCSYYKSVILPLVITAFIAYLLGSLIKMQFENNFLRLFLVCIVTSITIGLLSFVVVLKKNERILITEIVRKKIRKI